jgi:hypothetical protein
LGAPQAWLFPIFPWSSFAFAGLAIGFLLRSSWAKQFEFRVILLAGGFGAFLILAGRWLDGQPWRIYANDDFWHTSPSFFLIRAGILLITLWASYLWCRWGAALWGFSPLLQLGRTSLLVYWVHIELVYGRFSLLRRHSQTIWGATMGLGSIVLMMLVLSVARTNLKGRSTQFLTSLRRPAPS